MGHFGRVYVGSVFTALLPFPTDWIALIDKLDLGSRSRCRSARALLIFLPGLVWGPACFGRIFRNVDVLLVIT